MRQRSVQDFVELADGCYARRYPEWDTTVGVVVGGAGTLVVDTRASGVLGAALRDDVRRLAPDRPVRWVVNTHAHFDHTFGNVAFDGAIVCAHENAAAGLAAEGERVKELIRADPSPDPAFPAISAGVLAAVLATDYRVPDVTFSSVSTLDLGDRYVELVHPGRGHTDGDVVLRVPDADVMFVGDLVEESGDPSFGSDSFPLEWGSALDLVVGMLTPSSVVVPGHGVAVDRAFVQDQRADVAAVGALVRTLYAQGVPREEALAAGGDAWPYPADGLAAAVERGYAHLAEDADARPGANVGVQPGQGVGVEPPDGASRLPLA